MGPPAKWEPRPYIAGEPKSPLIASVLGPLLVITARARARAPAALHCADRGPQNPSYIGPKSPNHGGAHIAMTPVVAIRQ